MSMGRRRRVADDPKEEGTHDSAAAEEEVAGDAISAQPRVSAPGVMHAAVAGSRWRKQTYAKFAPYLAPFISTYLQEEIMTNIRAGRGHSTMMGQTECGTKWNMFPGAVLVADISGFTTLTEQLTKKGPGGIELLTKCINSYFDLIIGTVKAHGGDVIKFAGDAIICLFKPTGPEHRSPEVGTVQTSDQCQCPHDPGPVVLCFLR